MSQTSTYERISELLMYTGQQFLFFKIVQNEKASPK